MSLPENIISKILLYNIHPVAEIIADYNKKLLNFKDILSKLNIRGVYHFNSKLNDEDKLRICNFLNDTKHKNYWHFCCGDRGITCKKKYNNTNYF